MKQKSKWITPLIIVVVLVALIVTAVFAAYYKETVELKNTFEPASSIIPGISEKFEENDRKLKENVYFNVGETNYPVRVRAKIVVTWQDISGNIYFKLPIEKTDVVEDGDYEMVLNDADWEKKEDGFYYYKKVVESNGNTTNLINSCKQIKDAPAQGYTLSVDIIVQTVQAIGYTDDTDDDTSEPNAWKDAWNITEQTP